MRLMIGFILCLFYSPVFCQKNDTFIVDRFEKISFYDNKVIKEASLNADSLLNRYTIRFDSTGRLTSISEYVDGKLRKLHFTWGSYIIKYKRKRPIYIGGIPGCGTGRLEYGMKLEKLYSDLTSES